MRIILNSRMLPVQLLVVVLVLPACSARGVTPGSGRVRVVAAESFWGDLARQVAGPDARVTSVITNPDTDPHDYEPTAADARAIAAADLVIADGIGYDPWARQLVDANGNARPPLLDVGALVGVRAGGNPHQWYSDRSVREVIDGIAHDLEQVDPAHRSGYETRRRTLLGRGLAAYDALIAGIRRSYRGTPIGGSESIVSVLAGTLGLRLVTPQSFVDAVAEGNEPRASDKATADRQIARHEVKVFVFNRQNSTPDVERLVDAARRQHIPVVAITETLVPAGATFQQWQVSELRSMRVALAQAIAS